MNYKKFKLFSGNLEKWKVVCDVIRKARCDVCMLQETKINEMTFNYVARFLPSFFNFNCAYILARGTRRGQIVAWKKHYDLINSWPTSHTLTVLCIY